MRWRSKATALRYLPSHGPDRDTHACRALGWELIYLPYMDRKEN